MLCIGSGVLIGVISAALKNMPALEDFEYKPIEATRIYDANNNSFPDYMFENRVWVPLSEIRKNYRMQSLQLRIPNSLSITVWTSRIIRAFLVDIREGRIVQGGSTITQQLAKNAFLTHERTWARKLQELVYAIQLERTYTKDQILELYLNEVYSFLGKQSTEWKLQLKGTSAKAFAT